MAGRGLLEAFDDWATGRDGLEPDVAGTLAEFKKTYLDDANPGRWRPGDLTEVLELLPRKVSADEEWFAAVIPTARAFVTFAHGNGWLHRASAPLAALLQEIDLVEKDFDEAVHDPSQFGMAKSIFSQLAQSGVDVEAMVRSPEGVQSLMEQFNALPDDVRDRAIGSPLRSASGALARFEPAAAPDRGRRDIGSLPAVRIAPVAELATAARACPTLLDLDRFAGWLGERRAVTATGVLTLKEARSACEALGWPAGPDALPGLGADHVKVASARDMARLHRLWCLAEATEVIVVEATRVYPAAGRHALRALHETGPLADERVLDLWRRAYSATLLLGEDGGDERGMSFSTDGLAGTALVHAVMSSYTGDPVSLDELTTNLLRPRVTHVSELIQSAIIGSVRWRIRRFAGWLEALGACRLEDDPPCPDPSCTVCWKPDPVLGDLNGAGPSFTLQLTPLGTYGMRELVVGQGIHAPQVGDVAGLDAAQLVEQLPGVGPALAGELAQEWFAARGRAAAVQEMLALARTGPAGVRAVVLTTMAAALEDDLAAELAPVAQEPLLGPVTRGFVTMHAVVSRGSKELITLLERDPDALGRPDPPDNPAIAALGALTEGFGWEAADLSAQERDLMVVETVAAAVGDMPPPVHTDDLDPSLWNLVDEAGVPRLALTVHPERLQVLEALGSGHPVGRVRKAAKKAVHKLRIAGATRGDG